IIKIKGEPDDVENIAMTVYGPVTYDRNYKAADGTDNAYALRWSAHDPSNELLTFYQLNKAKNYDDYVNAISTFQCPGQNLVFASKTGDIAIRQQGKFVAKWNQQGDFVMPGTDSSYNWQGFIPVNENPQMKNPARAFVSSANQKSVDTTYPYYLGRAANFDIYRGYIINRYLASMSNITPEDMQRMQTDNYNLFAEVYRPVLLKYLNEAALNENEKKYFTIYKNWNLRNDALEEGATIFSLWKDSLEQVVFADEYSGAKLPMVFPTESSLVENIIRDSNYKFIDNVLTKDKKETVSDDVLLAFKKIVPGLDSLNRIGRLNWGAFKDTRVSHLTKLDALSRLHLPIGGGAHIINAASSDHGPSWRMIVLLTDKTEAYGVYPGGQNGNPGSKYYDTFIDKWSVGEYYKLLVLTKEEAQKEAHIKWKMEVRGR
ncbi:MAG: penicillin acylase family protein, partial [Chitinophagaceae bacterium]|nr:penicillin acylase family protein [Chitinophagaceae bacterium]